MMRSSPTNALTVRYVAMPLVLLTLGLAACATPGSLDGTGGSSPGSGGSGNGNGGPSTGNGAGNGTSSGAGNGSGSGNGSGTSSGAGSGTGTSGTSTTSGGGSTGSGTSIGSCQVFPSDNAWNADVSQLPVHPSSDAIVNSIGRSKHLHPDFGSVYGIPYVVVPGTQPKVPVSFQYSDESDPGPYPIPPDAPIEAGSDAHVLVIDGATCMLYELWQGATQNGGASWTAGSGAVWNLQIDATRPAGWTSADAAGLPVFPGLARYDEIVVDHAIHHALRFTVQNTRAAYVAPASHFASNDTSANLPAMGMRFRMKAGFDCSSFSQEAQVMCTALKTYGMILADNGADWYISGAPNPGFDDNALGDVKLWTGDAFEVVYTGDAITQ